MSQEMIELIDPLTFLLDFSPIRSEPSIMSCRFPFLLLLFFTSIFQRYFSSIHFAPARQHLQYAFPSNPSHRNHVQRRSTSRDLFQIHIHYDRSVDKLLRAEEKLIHEAVQQATDYWSQTIRPKFQLNDRIRLSR